MPKQPHTQTEVKLGTAREARTSILVPENSTYKHFFLQYPKWFTEAGMSDHITQVCDLCQLHGWLVAALSSLMISLFYQEISEPTQTQ